VAVLVGLLLVSGGAIAAAALDPPDHPSVSPVSSAASSRSATSAPSPSQTAPPQAPSTPVATGARAATRGPVNVYAAPASGVFSRAVAGIPQRVYVPNVSSGTISVIDPKTYQVIKTLQVGGRPHHITPSWDLKHLYIDNPGSGSLREIDPRTAALGPTIAARTPYNLYFTPDGTKAIVVAEYAQQLVFRDRRTWRVLKVVPIPGRGVDHMDFSANGRYLLVSCEYTGVVARVSTISMRVTGTLNVGGRPIDVKVSPDGKVFYVANQGTMGVSIIDPIHMKQIKFLPTGLGAHGFAVSRDARYLYLSNRIAGTISVISFRSRSVVDRWNVGGSPDMLQVSPDGSHLWASNRFGNTVSVISTRTGGVLHRIVVGQQPHGLAYFPQPGRYSVGHNGVYR